MRDRDPRAEGGQVLVISVLFLFVVFGMAAFAIDASLVRVARHKAQVAADAASLAAAQDLESSTVSSSTVTTDGSTLAADNDPAGTATISQPTSSQVKAQVSQTLSLPFFHVLGLASPTVSASATAQLQANTTVVGDANISAAGCNNAATSYCEYFSSSSCTYPGSTNFTGPTIGTGPWQLYSGYNTNTNVFNFTSNTGCSSVDLQNCTGAVLTVSSCVDQNGNAITNEVVDLNGNSPGGMYQTISNTQSGASYVLTFLLSGNPAGESCTYDTFTGYVQIISGGLGGTQLTKQTFSHTNQCSNNTETATFQVVTVPFVAQSSSTTLLLQSTTCTSNGTNNTCPGSPGNYVFYGPEVTNIALAYPTVALVQ